MSGIHVAAVVGALACHVVVFALLNSQMTFLAIFILLYALFNMKTGDDPLMFGLALAQVGLVLSFGVSAEWSALTLFGAGCAVFAAMQFSMLARMMRREAVVDPSIVRGFGLAMTLVTATSVGAAAALLAVEPMGVGGELPRVAGILAAATAFVVALLVIRRRAVEAG